MFNESLGRVVSGACALVFGVVMGFACSAPTTGNGPKEGDDDDIIPIDDDDSTPPAATTPRPKTTPKVDAGTSTTGTGSCVNADSDKCLACCETKNPNAVEFENAYTTCLTAPNADPDDCKAQHLEACADNMDCINNHECMRTAGCLAQNGCD